MNHAIRRLGQEIDRLRAQIDDAEDEASKYERQAQERRQEKERLASALNETLAAHAALKHTTSSEQA